MRTIQEEQINQKEDQISKRENPMKKESKPNNKKLAEVKATETDYPEIPELDSSFFENAELVIPEPQKSISLSIDSDVLSWFKKTGRGYQTKMNAALRMFMEGQA